MIFNFLEARVAENKGQKFGTRSILKSKPIRLGPTIFNPSLLSDFTKFCSLFV